MLYNSGSPMNVPAGGLVVAAVVTEGWRLRKHLGSWAGEWLVEVLERVASVGLCSDPSLEAVIPIPPPPMVGHCPLPKLYPSQGAIHTQC